MSAADAATVVEAKAGGAPPRHVDLATAQLDRLARGWIDVQQTRLALAQRDLEIPGFEKGEAQLSRMLSRALRDHPLWPWLSQFPGLGGAHTALVVGRIGDPRRFPGQRCTEGHYLPPLYAAGAPCPIAEYSRADDGEPGDGASPAGTDEPANERKKSNGRPGSLPPADASNLESDKVDVCPGVMLPPRTTTGVRSLWHWAGLHAVDGKSPRKTKGVRCDWEPRVRASILMPDAGIAAQIVRHRVPVYRDLYDATKDRLTAERGQPAERAVENGDTTGGLRAENAELQLESDSRGGDLRPIQIDHIARKVAAKAFLGDLLTEWKRTLA